MVELVRTEIDILSAVSKVGDPSAGAIDVFIGTTRNTHKGRGVELLEYESYESMALKVMEKIVDEARRTWNLKGVAVVHRLGKVRVGEASVVIAVSAMHRAEAFEGCRFLIDQLKKEVPIWKKEYFTDGHVEWSGSDVAIG
ncbi:MAG: molybdenum cofactor biosynthesis protein MoaE [Ignavibacteria bacterium]|nr:molybdenum cofactor biosynthesis protein MoaE [Ignavibacteria bacterium]